MDKDKKNEYLNLVHWFTFGFRLFPSKFRDETKSSLSKFFCEKNQSTIFIEREEFHEHDTKALKI